MVAYSYYSFLSLILKLEKNKTEQELLSFVPQKRLVEGGGRDALARLTTVLRLCTVDFALRPSRIRTPPSSAQVL